MMEFTKEQIMMATKTLEGAKVMVANRDFDEFQNAIITALNAFALVKELTAENEELKDKVRIQHKIIDERAEAIIRHDNFIRDLHKQLESCKADTVQKMQKRLEKRIDQTIQVFDFQISECTAIRQVLRGVKNDIYQIAKEVLEENK